MTKTEGTSTSFSVASKVKDYFQLIKFTLSFTVVFSCVICYLLAPNIVGYDWKMIGILFFAGMLITGSANAINQGVEKDTDAMMKRTSRRPVASGRMSQSEAFAFAAIAGILGVWMIGWYFKADDNSFNWNAALLSAFSLFLYAFIYTPLKKINSVAVLVGAFPGALPCLIGWVAATNMIYPFGTVTANGKEFSNAGGWVLFAIQFLWQFPHFWAIAWALDDDYKKAGFYMLPSLGGRDKSSSFQIVVYTLFLLGVSLMPNIFGFSSWNAGIFVFLCGLFFFAQALTLFYKMDVASARKLMFGSFFYLPLVQLIIMTGTIWK